MRIPRPAFFTVSSVLLLVLSLWPFLGKAQLTSPVGLWEDETGEARVEVVATRDGELAGRLVWMRHAIDARTGLPHTDGRNPNPSLRTRPLQHLLVLYDVRYNPEEDRWDGGEIYDPHSGHYYSCFLRLHTRDRLEVKGFIGFSLLGKSHFWRRLKPGSVL